MEFNLMDIVCIIYTHTHTHNINYIYSLIDIDLNPGKALAISCRVTAVMVNLKRKSLAQNLR